MLLLIWLVLCLFAVGLLLLPLALWLREIRRRYSGSRLVACPGDQQSAVVTLDARRAVATGVDGDPDLRLSACSRWPEHAQCHQGCLPQAIHAEPGLDQQRKAGAKQIYHLPIFLAAFVAWYLGAVWHSQYLFRARWLDAAGLTQLQAKQMVWWLSPHLLTAAIWLLFAYGVAWLLLLCHRKGVLWGVLMSAIFCAVMIAACSFGLARIPHELFVMEAGYTAVAVLLVGAIVGGLYDKLVLPSHH